MSDRPNAKIEYDELESALNRLRSLKEDAHSANGTLNKEIRDVVESYGWHKTALSMIRALDDMPPVKRKEVLEDFDQMYDLMHAKKWADEQLDLFSDMTEQE